MSDNQKVVQLLKSWEYKNVAGFNVVSNDVVQLLKSWEYKNLISALIALASVVQLLKSWEYKNHQEYRWDKS